MAVTPVQQNIIINGIAISGELVKLAPRMLVIRQMYYNEGLGDLAPEDLAALPDLAHLTAGEITNMVAAFKAILEALGLMNAAGEPLDGYNAGNAGALLKMLPGYPG